MARFTIRETFFVVFLAAHGVFAQETPALAVKAHFNLTLAADGFTGTLELLEDARITPKLDKALWQSGGPEMALDENDPLLKQIASSPLQRAMLRLRDAKGRVVEEKKLEREQARLEVHQLHPGHRSILVTTDLSAGFGSYSGPFTRILDLSRSSLDFVRARQSLHGDEATLSLANTLKTAWRIIHAPASFGPGLDILEVACRPELSGAESPKFQITYTRYHWNGKGWLTAASQRSGIWEADEPFPSFAFFPDIPTETYARQSR
jgi:hypothetical protein